MGRSAPAAMRRQASAKPAGNQSTTSSAASGVGRRTRRPSWKMTGRGSWSMPRGSTGARGTM
uniref:Uncharacterized protein n=1 Tax=Arundo donax TaxID=35708 RepID=A0A0A9CT34_ARUDO